MHTCGGTTTTQGHTYIMSYQRHIMMHVQRLSYQLDQKLCFDPSRGFVLSVASLSQQGVDLVHEDDGWLEAPGHSEQGPHHLLPFANLHR